MKYGITFHLKQLQYKSLLNHSEITSSNYSMHLFVYCMNLVNYHFDQVRRKFPFLSKVRYVKQPQATKLTSSLHFSLVIGITYNFTVFFYISPLWTIRACCWNVPRAVSFADLQVNLGMYHKPSTFSFFLWLFFYHIESFQISSPVMLLHLSY